MRLTVRSVRVNGKTAKWRRDAGELTITPRSGLPKGKDFAVVIRYRGVPETITDMFGISGFIHTDDGELVIGEPHVAPTWFPANDHPRDKASFTFRITVPKVLEAIANGVNQEQAHPRRMEDMDVGRQGTHGHVPCRDGYQSSISVHIGRTESGTGMPSTPG